MNSIEYPSDKKLVFRLYYLKNWRKNWKIQIWTTFYFKMFYLNEQRIDADSIHSFENNLIITYLTHFLFQKNAQILHLCKLGFEFRFIHCFFKKYQVDWRWRFAFTPSFVKIHYRQTGNFSSTNHFTELY